jgi:hypothetical protein
MPSTNKEAGSEAQNPILMLLLLLTCMHCSPKGRSDATNPTILQEDMFLGIGGSSIHIVTSPVKAGRTQDKTPHTQKKMAKTQAGSMVQEGNQQGRQKSICV